MSKLDIYPSVLIQLQKTQAPLSMLDADMNQAFNVPRRGKRPFAPTQIHVSIQQHLFFGS